jgi:hypothetical protein
VFAQCGSPISTVTSGIRSINFIPLPGDPHGATGPAIGIWSSPDSGCDGMGTSYPDLTTGTYHNYSDIMNVYIFYHAGMSTEAGGRCGKTDVQLDPNTGQITGASVEMWETQADGADCVATMPELVAHEIGHVLGLADAYGNAQCNGTIMGANPSFVSSDQCAVVKDTWYTPPEQEDTELQNCEATCPQRCELNFYTWYCPLGGDSPIIIDLNDDGYNLTNPENGVWFDLNADGRRERLSWTASGSDDAFLCLDRSGDGRINDGRELFGNFTLLADGTIAPNGFVALAEFDTPALGGNGDGVLDARDRVWPSLLLWQDTNHDGISSPNELKTLADAGVRSIDLHYILSKHTDQYGNAFRYRAKAIVTDKEGKSHNAKIYDVFLIINVNAKPTGN